MNSRIERIVATEVIVRAKQGHVDRPGFGPSLFDRWPKWMIELHTDDGLVGYGESPRRSSLSDIQWAARRMLGRRLGEIGWARCMPCNWAEHDALGHPDPPVPHRFHEVRMGRVGGVMGVGMAVQDLIAKAAGLRLCDLFGGAYRERVPVSWWMGRSDPAHAERQMQVGLDHGFTAMKFKCTAEDDVPGIVAAIKKVAGECTEVHIDPNFRFYRLTETLRMVRRLEAFEGIVLEDPFPFRPEEYSLLRQKSDVPLAVHAGDKAAALRNNCCDYVNCEYPAQRFMEVAAMAAEYGVQCWAGSGVELGILDAYMLHYASTAPNCVLSIDAMGHLIRENDLIEQDLLPEAGEMAVPERPGLGVTLDRDAVAHYAQDTWEEST